MGSKSKNVSGKFLFKIFQKNRNFDNQKVSIDSLDGSKNNINN